MTAVFITVLNMSITASIVALAVMLARIPLKKAPKIFSYALWGIVMFRLIFPFSIESIFSLMPTPTNIMPQVIAPTQNLGVQYVDTPVRAAAGSAMPIIGQAGESNLVISAIEVAGYVWFFGFIVLLAYAVMGYVSLKRRVCFATLIRDNIYETDSIKTPFVLGFIHPKIYFPTTLDPSQHDYILRHEQVHIQRCDYLIKPFAYIVFALHWFNPLMWIAYFLMSRDIEMSCDEAVLRKTDEDIRYDYSTSLLNLSTKRASLLNPIAFAYGEGNVKERIVNVLGFKKSASWVTVASVIVVGIFLVGFSSDRIMAIDTPSSVNVSSYINAPSFNIVNWNIDEQGARVAHPEQAREIGIYVLNRYFSIFRHDWENWGDNSFSLISHPTFYDEFGNAHTQPWTGGVFANELTVIEDAVWGDTSFLAPLFLFYIDTETGQLNSAIYVAPKEYMATSIAPFTFNFEEAIDIFGNEWLELSSELNSEYVNMLTNFSLEFLGVAGLLNSGVTATNIINAWGNFYENHVNPALAISLANGKEVIIFFQVHETQFTIEGLTLNF